MKRTLLILLLLLCPVILVLWQLFFDDTNYYLVSVILLALSIVPFLISFENEHHSAREISLLAGLIAIAVVSRAVFYMIPQVKPIGAVIVASGACLGAKRGYIVGMLSAFISNFIFGQGTWTPFQMVAFGMVGLISGLFFARVKPNKFILSLVGFLLTFALYGVIVDLGTALVMSANLTISSLLAVYAAGIPFGLVFGVTTAIVLLLFGEAFIKKINRIIKKYGV